MHKARRNMRLGLKPYKACVVREGKEISVPGQRRRTRISCDSASLTPKDNADNVLYGYEAIFFGKAIVHSHM